jgi:hypothetical protein
MSNAMATAVAIALVVLTSVSTLLNVYLTYYWKDARTRRHKTVRGWLIGLSALSSAAAVIVTIRAENQSQSLTQALNEAEHERKAQASSGQFEPRRGKGPEAVYSIGNSGVKIEVPEGRSLLYPLLANTPLLGSIGEQNSVSSKTVGGKLLVSARIRARDGLVAEIVDNEWRVSPPPKTWDRNYSPNALEVKDSEGSIVFQIKLDEDTTGSPGSGGASLQGIFYDSDGNGVAITAAPGGDGAFVTVMPKGSAIRVPQISPLFKYPSSLHLGEFAGKN